MFQFLKIPILAVAILLSGFPALSSMFPVEDQSANASGQELYSRLACNGCHALRSQGDQEGLNLDGVGSRLSRQDLEVQLTTPRHRLTNSRMPSFAFVQPDDLQILLDFLQTLK